MTGSDAAQPGSPASSEVAGGGAPPPALSPGSCDREPLAAHQGFRGSSTRTPLFVLSLQKLDIDLRAIDANQFAATIGEAGRREQQEEFLEVRGPGLNLRPVRMASLSDIALSCAVAPPLCRRWPMMQTLYPRLNVTRSGPLFSSDMSHIPAIAATFGALAQPPEILKVDTGLKPSGR